MANEYEKLLSFLESQEPKVEVPTQKSTIKKPDSSAKTQKEKVLLNTKKIIEESEIYSYVPPLEKYNSISSSKGFDVKKFESLMRSKLIDSYKRIQSYERPYISVSELYGCLRQAFYNRSKYSIDLKKQFGFSYLYLIQKIGDEIHDIIQGLYDFTETEKTLVSEKYKVKGRLDAIRERFLYEIKSIDQDKFKNEYVETHFLQANIYAYILNEEYDGYNIEEVVLIYVIRNLKRIIPFDLPINNDLAKSHLERAPVLLSSIEQKITPDPIGAIKEHCQYCLYKKYCEQDQCNKVFQPFKQKNTVKTQQQKVGNKERPTFLL
jgi:CRISPR/Cas system-associated exonuclease Cas4 (RecB family)